VSPPPGLVISTLPPYYSTVWIGGVPYYYADDVYYSWQPDQNAICRGRPPTMRCSLTPPPPPDSAQADLIIYPKNGQTKGTAGCRPIRVLQLGEGQTGFDPTQPEAESRQRRRSAQQL